MQKVFFIVLISFFFMESVQSADAVKFSEDDMSPLYEQVGIPSSDSYESIYRPYSSYMLGQRFQYRPHGIKRVSENDINTLLRNTWIG
uniref:Secreted protein n=1 Tax=Parastrongyloides trichosuri TaxID=131310 RepID=A0A0N5A3R3_PARTI